MKGSKRCIVFAVVAVLLLCTMLIFVACDKDNQSDIVELRVENAKINFMCGDMFETGDNFKVYAEHKDGSIEDVTVSATVRKESGMDMSVAGDYQITVAFADKRVIYTVYVNDSENVLRRIELDTSAVTKQYRLGDKVSLDGLVLSLTYENSQNVVFSETTTALNDFNIAIVGTDGTVIDDIFTSLGTFTVTVSRGNVKASFNMTADSVNISTVQSALAVGGYYSRDVASGNIRVQGARMYIPEGSTLKPGEAFTTESYEYAFGDNYTYFKESHNAPVAEYHCTVDSEGLFVTYLQDGVISTSNRNNPSMMNGAPLFLWYNSETVYGVENMLNNLYSHALKSSNNDLKETVDESKKTYSFTFSGLEQRDIKSDYYETTVTFKLGENYAITNVEVTQDYYENNSSLSGQEGYKPTFTTDVSGKTKPNGDYTYRTLITVEQTLGERTAQNKYGRDMFNVSSYKLMYDGKELADNAVLECVAGNMYNLQIVDVLPSTANLAVDVMLFDYEGNREGADLWIANEHFSLTRSGNNITLSTKHGGTWTFIFKTKNTTRTLKINVIGEAPREDMKPKLLNNASGTFYDGNEKTISVGDEVYFYGAVEQYANAAQTATVYADYAQYATVTPTTVGGVACWKFTATKEGTYQVTVVSDVAAIVRCIFTFTVSKVDFTGLLSGTYTVQDRAGVIYTATFAVNDSEPIAGSVSVTRTPTDEDDNLIVDKAVTQTFTFSVEGTRIAVAHSVSDTIWVEFEVDENNNIVLIDQHNIKFVMTKSSNS